MRSKDLTRIMTSGLLALLCTLPAAAANLAGSAVFVSGKATATDPAGGVRELKARDSLYSGDLLETRKGRVQIKFLDGAFMSIQPNSRFQIEDYNYANASDGSEKAIYYLFKGGMRALTGAIGKKHPDAYKVKTPVATIGIRGTGHNDRLCAGDCIGLNGQALPDGLYHSTWEGTTFVETNLGITEVPLGGSVRVPDIDSPVEQIRQAPVVTAMQPSVDTVEELVEEQGDQAVLEAGEELASNGAPTGLPVPVTTVLPNQGLVAVLPNSTPNIPEEFADVGLLYDTTNIIGADSLNNKGLLTTAGLEADNLNLELPVMFFVTATIDPDGLQAINSTDPNVVAAQGLIAAARISHPAVVADVVANPAKVAEFFQGGGFAFGRWADGYILLLDEDRSGFALPTVEMEALVNNQSLHFIYGNAPELPSPGSGATGIYTFIDGTRSTTASGDTIDMGVTSGELNFDFDNSFGTITMSVRHLTDYAVTGSLRIDDFGTGAGLFHDEFVVATTAAGSCISGCTTFINGGFAGPLSGEAQASPAFAGLEYHIDDPNDGIMGVAAFGRTGDGSATLIEQ